MNLAKYEFIILRRRTFAQKAGARCPHFASVVNSRLNCYFIFAFIASLPEEDEYLLIFQMIRMHILNILKRFFIIGQDGHPTRLPGLNFTRVF